MSGADQGADAPVVIEVVRTGGIAGIRRTWRAESAGDDAPRWIALIDRCAWDAPAERVRGADRYTWTVRARASGRECARELPDAELTGAWRDLVDAVRSANAAP